MSEDERALLKHIEQRVDHIAWFTLMLLIMVSLLLALSFGVIFGG